MSPPRPALRLSNGERVRVSKSTIFLHHDGNAAVSIALTAIDAIEQAQNGRCLSVYVECGGKTTQLGAISLHSSCSRSGTRPEKVQCLDGRRHDGRCQTFSDKVSPGDGGLFRKHQAPRRPVSRYSSTKGVRDELRTSIMPHGPILEE